MNATRDYVLHDISLLLDQKKAENVEKSLYNYTLQQCELKDIVKDWSNILFTHLYKQHYLFIKANILNNEAVLEKIKTKEIQSKDVAFLRLEDLRQFEGDQAEMENEEVAEGIFQCKKCGSKRTTYYSLQTRSADEPMTNFITCVECKNRWKM